MTKYKLLQELNGLLKESHHEITRYQLNTLVLDISRILDRIINRHIKNYINETHHDLNTVQRHDIRLALLGYPVDNQIKPLHITKSKLNLAYKYILDGYKENSHMMQESLVSRYKKYFLHDTNHIVQRYVDYLHKLQKNHYQLLYINVNTDKISFSDLSQNISSNYNKLSNYHNCVITFTSDYTGCINWNLIAKTAMYMANFKLEKHFHTFNEFNRSKQIKRLYTFLQKNNYIKNKDYSTIINKFYNGLSYGFRFIDLFIGDHCKKVSLVMQKVQLDNTPKRCPACFHLTKRGNSYMHVLFKSFECQNPACPARSKSNRGKRFDLLSAKKQIMLKRNDLRDHIDSTIIKGTRRDVVNSKYLCLETMIQLYTWAEDHVLTLNCSTNRSYKGRIINNNQLKHYPIHHALFNKLPIVRLLKDLNSNIVYPQKSSNGVSRYKYSLIINDNSDQLLFYKDRLGIDIDSAITSPPYYNARAYSQWDNFLCYLIDMLVNAKAVYKSLSNHSIYIYNVGDIVDQDNVFIHSRMSITRLMLGFYSALILEIAGFHLKTDIIWDKGEVQSKRNSTPNHFPGYVKPINSYEHDLVLCKGSYEGDTKYIKSHVVRIPAVKKINSKGKNTYGHSAPFPLKIASLILPFVTKQSCVLDPFLGSGTTCIMANQHHLKSIGVELDKKYYKLSVNRIKHFQDQLTLF